jgi:hypothetical protein
MFTPYPLFSRPTAIPTLSYRIEPKIAKSSADFEAALPISMTVGFNPLTHVDVRDHEKDAS